MEPLYLQDKQFEKEDFTINELVDLGNHFEDCQFRQCDFSKSDISNLRFFDCEFFNCNFSLTQMDKTLWQNALFTDCKMMGVHFENCSSFGWEVRFEGCLLNHSSFYGMKLAGQSYNSCELKGVDFTSAMLAGAVFPNCNLENAKFVQTDLTKADFSTAYNYCLDPEQNKLAKAKFSQDGLVGLLAKYKIVVT